MQNQSTFQVYNASAGSGKTFTLVKEYLKILLQNSDLNRFQNILAVTFTNKAAAEMKARVINNLLDFAKPEILLNKNEMFLQIQRETNLKDSIIHQKSAKILQNILNNYAAFNITTIDSFTYRLIRSFAFDLGLSLNFEVEMDAKSLLNEAVDLLISKIGEDKELTKILIDFSLQKANEDKSWDITFELREIASILLNESDINKVQRIKEKPISDFVDLKMKLRKRQKELETSFAEIGKEGLQIIDNFELQHNDFYRSMIPNHFKNLAYKLENAKFFDQNKLKERIEERNFYSKSKPEEIKTAIDSIINPLIDLYSSSEKLYQEYTLNKLISKGLIPLAVLSKLNIVLDEIKEEKNIRLNAEFNHLISKNLREQPAAFIYERIGEKLKHYFIDEMQDTSLLQWKNLIPLIDNALSQENSSLLLVGDAKQSIYRWRGGEAEQFIKLSLDEESDDSSNPFFVNKQLQLLDTNYRSYNEIINFNNNFFQFIADYFNKSMYNSIYKRESEQKETQKKGGYVELSFIDEGLSATEKDEIYPEKVFQIINDLEGVYEKNEICVLTRTRKQGVIIANYLSNNNIDIISSETLLLKNSAKVNFIINLLTYFVQLTNKEAKLEVLYFLYDHLNISTDKHQFFSQLIHESINGLAKKLGSFQINFNYQNFIQLPFYESVEYIIRSFKLTQSSDAYIQFFLDEVLHFAQRSSDGLEGFLDYWEQKKDSLSIIVQERKDAVRIMTIHKSKGLEFPVVIFPYDLDIYREHNTKLWYPVKEKDKFKNFSTLLVNYNKSLEHTGSIGKELYQSKRHELELDNLNLLYVTLTRAVEQLYIISEAKKSGDPPKFYSQFFIEYLKFNGIFNEQKTVYSFGSKMRLSSKKTATHTSYELQNFTSTPWQDHNINIAINASLFWDEDKQESISFGNLIHEMLSKIKTSLDINEVITQYYRAGLIQKDALKEIKQMIYNVVNHPQLKPYFSQNNTVYNEREIITSDKEIIIPDRLVINNNKEAIIIDYKTGKPNINYRFQVEKYAKAIGELGFFVKKKILVYISDIIEIEEV